MSFNYFIQRIIYLREKINELEKENVQKKQEKKKEKKSWRKS